ncbi:MAG TPA: hypothetical protein VIF64_10695 [Pyrinomonadaceae bacterium]|jgi:hypothetical protein
MNNESDYLWDKSGKPDPEIQQLEEILGTLRYQPRPLEIPADTKVDLRPRFFTRFAPRLAPGLAIAATIVVVLLGFGLWLGLQRLQRGHQAVATTEKTAAPDTTPVPASQTVPAKNQDELVKVPDRNQKHSEGVRRHRFNNSLMAGNTNRNQPHKNLGKDPQLTEKELQEGKAAKDQLMLALRVASAKLNFAQKKTQNINPRDAVHNQHRIG